MTEWFEKKLVEILTRLVDMFETMARVNHGSEAPVQAPGAGTEDRVLGLLRAFDTILRTDTLGVDQYLRDLNLIHVKYMEMADAAHLTRIASNIYQLLREEDEIK